MSDLYAFELDKKYIPKKRICVYAPIELSKKIDKCAKMESEKSNKKVSANKLILKVLQDFIREYDINA
ncbi:hypothetical protein KQI36_15980 [Clostridium senegalense]|uniref:hypothetical protein n=1 Tax=Clostridium senegalense TaxID=1465809 RepID=UPI001294C84A|nr:hypothetical protein [Clostridium senegalense]MBU5228131.1 hypothetical protein [Clostridium senegalense]MPU17613.1 hypothetical protein [Acinetobacter baumannii]